MRLGTPRITCFAPRFAGCAASRPNPGHNWPFPLRNVHLWLGVRRGSESIEDRCGLRSAMRSRRGAGPSLGVIPPGRAHKLHGEGGQERPQKMPTRGTSLDHPLRRVFFWGGVGGVLFIWPRRVFFGSVLLIYPRPVLYTRCVPNITDIDET